MRKTLQSLLLRTFAIAVIAAGFAIIWPSAAYATNQVSCTSISIEGPEEITKAGAAVEITVHLTFDGVVNNENQPSININYAWLIPNSHSYNYPGNNAMTSTISLRCPSDAIGETNTITVSCGGITASKTLRIIDPSAHSITVNKNGGGNSTASASATSAAQGTSITLTATPAQGYTFVNWTSNDINITNATSATGASFNMPATAVTVTANFVEDSSGSARSDSSSDDPPKNDPPAEPENELEKAVNASNSQITGTVNQLNALIASGKTAEVNALRAKGITIDAEKDNLMCFKNGTYELIYKATQAGIPVTINFRYMGFRFATTIPAYTKLNPVTLCNKDGFCGFCNIMYHYGGRLR